MKSMMLVSICLLSACVFNTKDQATVNQWPVKQAQLNSQYWVNRAKNASRLRLDAAQIQVLNQQMIESEATLVDLNALNSTLSREQLLAIINEVSAPPTSALFDVNGQAIVETQFTAIMTNLNKEGVPAKTTLEWGLIVKRHDLRAFPTELSVFKTNTDKDIDRFQESALFPGTAVAVLHSSADKQWHLVQSANYRAWIKASAVALGDRDDVLNYGNNHSSIVITAAQLKTNFTPENPAVSELALDMGNRYPVILPAPEVINGQGTQVHHVINLPVRDDTGNLQFTSALIPINQDVNQHYLPYTEANLISQAFKFLGERYGWGHRYNGRDCSGFVSEVYRSFGIALPRNTGDQAKNKSLRTLTFSKNDDLNFRIRHLKASKIGDLIFIPGHVMMVIGQENDEIYVIHDTAGIALLDNDKKLQRIKLNGVYVTPLLSLMSNESTSTVMNITAIQHIMPTDSRP